jgi:hypothetical protein
VTAFEEVEKKGKIPVEPRNSNLSVNLYQDTFKPNANTNSNPFEAMKPSTNFKYSNEMDIKVNIQSVPIVKSSVPINNGISVIVTSNIIV